eukprot:scaffold39949_cov67-Phaeocystis_antarctica.AAC.2
MCGAHVEHVAHDRDVSKLSGWLNAAADCRVERRVYDAERGVGRGRESVGRRLRTSGMHGERARTL